MLDMTLFAGFCYVIYYHGTDIAKAVEEIVPTEQGMMEMIQQQQAQQQMMMPPMWFNSINSNQLSQRLMWTDVLHLGILQLESHPILALF